MLCLIVQGFGYVLEVRNFNHLIRQTLRNLPTGADTKRSGHDPANRLILH